MIIPHMEKEINMKYNSYLLERGCIPRYLILSPKSYRELSECLCQNYGMYEQLYKQKKYRRMDVLIKNSEKSFFIDIVG